MTALGLDQREALAARLRMGADALGCPVDEWQERSLLDYLELLAKWNRVYNLSGIRKPEDMLVQHLFDCLAPIPFVVQQFGEEGQHVLDVGSGGGLPGIVWAIMLRHRFTCVDTVAKKASFIQEAASRLALANVRAVHARAETLPARQFDLVVARAFASLPDLVAMTTLQLKERGYWLALKGKTPEGERAALPLDVEVFHVEQLTVPQLDARRCLVCMRRR
jgi:16S rRNA (guanine527-N7)-methyltransferase